MRQQWRPARSQCQWANGATSSRRRRGVIAASAIPAHRDRRWARTAEDHRPSFTTNEPRGGRGRAKERDQARSGFQRSAPNTTDQHDQQGAHDTRLHSTRCAFPRLYAPHSIALIVGVAESRAIVRRIPRLVERSRRPVIAAAADRKRRAAKRRAATRPQRRLGGAEEEERTAGHRNGAAQRAEGRTDKRGRAWRRENSIPEAIRDIKACWAWVIEVGRGMRALSLE